MVVAVCCYFAAKSFTMGWVWGQGKKVPWH